MGHAIAAASALKSSRLATTRGKGAEIGANTIIAGHTCCDFDFRAAAGFQEEGNDGRSGAHTPAAPAPCASGGHQTPSRLAGRMLDPADCTGSWLPCSLAACSLAACSLAPWLPGSLAACSLAALLLAPLLPCCLLHRLHQLLAAGCWPRSGCWLCCAGCWLHRLLACQCGLRPRPRNEMTHSVCVADEQTLDQSALLDRPRPRIHAFSVGSSDEPENGACGVAALGPLQHKVRPSLPQRKGWITQRLGPASRTLSDSPFSCRSCYQQISAMCWGLANRPRPASATDVPPWNLCAQPIVLPSTCVSRKCTPRVGFYSRKTSMSSGVFGGCGTRTIFRFSPAPFTR